MSRTRIASERRDIDFSRWPGVYVHPGVFKPTVEEGKKEEEAWERYRDRWRRLRKYITRRRETKGKESSGTASASVAKTNGNGKGKARVKPAVGEGK